ncbi:hypothetical protein B0J18DRAFT_465224 [Chaetomium sp. MPI-SDFR-AT-0129]|nr:hypothetical protein B0J18DRAFT_465224 [Chaetomium sp. MPI-SDFR-AT-0129]
MQRLDSDDISEADDNDDRENISELAQKLVDKPIVKPSPKKQDPGLPKKTMTRIKAEQSSPHTVRLPGPSPKTTGKSGSPFMIPQGSQVVSLLTSSPEPELEEDYAEDSIDETYNEPDGGWLGSKITCTTRRCACFDVAIDESCVRGCACIEAERR